MSRLATGVLFAAMSVSSVTSMSDLEVGEVGTKVVSGPDDDGDLQISIKVTVTNYSDKDRLVSLGIQGCDDEDFEVFQTSLDGMVESNQTRTLTDTVYIKEAVYESVTQWRAEE